MNITKFYCNAISAVYLCLVTTACATQKETAANIAKAEDFVDAFYSFDRSLLEPKLARAPDSAGIILFYQGFAQGGNYKIIERQACQPIDSAQVSCSITVEDDPMLALKIDFHVTDTFTITFENENLVKVENSSNDLPIYFEAQNWAFKNFPEIKTGPCLGFFDGGATPAACARAMTKAYEQFTENKDSQGEEDQ
jgi:hypothetical protein